MTHERAFNFCSGPAMMPVEALQAAQAELLDYGGTGMSILEHSHRGPEYDAVHEEALALLRELVPVPETHDVLLLQGGATQQFAQLPMNFLGAGQTADYIVCGTWGEKSVAEARAIGAVHVAATTLDGATYNRRPRADEIHCSERPVYLHLASNETIHGIEWSDAAMAELSSLVSVPPLVVDASSNILSKPFDLSRIAMLYAGAQKNIGPSGVCVVIISKDFLAHAKHASATAPYFRYATHAKTHSLTNTPPTFSVYLIRNVLRWLKNAGGPVAMATINQRKADLLYSTLHEHAAHYELPVEVESRSRMNVVFRLRDATRDAAFLAAAEKRNMTNLAGHRTVGGMRASIYNAMPLAGVERLCELVREFAVGSVQA